MCHFELKIFSGINDWNHKTDFLYIPNQNHEIKFGSNFTYHVFTPGNATGKSGEVDFSPDEIYKQYSNEGAIYISDDIEFTDDFFEKFKQVCAFEQKDIIFLGYSMAEKERNKIDISGSTVQLNKLNKTRYIGGFFSYLINKNGAKKLVDYIDKNGIV